MKALLLSACAALALTGLSACQSSEPAAALTPETLAQEWQLVGFAGGALPPHVTMDLREAGRATGQAPCNRWFGSVEGTLPEFRIAQAGATRMACPDLDAESAFLTALTGVTTAALEGDRLVLTGGDGQRLEFARTAQ